MRKQLLKTVVISGLCSCLFICSGCQVSDAGLFFRKNLPFLDMTALDVGTLMDTAISEKIVSEKGKISTVFHTDTDNVSISYDFSQTKQTGMGSGMIVHGEKQNSFSLYADVQNLYLNKNDKWKAYKDAVFPGKDLLLTGNTFEMDDAELMDAKESVGSRESFVLTRPMTGDELSSFFEKAGLSFLDSSESDADVRLWIDTVTYLPVKEEIVMSDTAKPFVYNGQDLKDFTFTLTYYGFNNEKDCSIPSESGSVKLKDTAFSFLKSDSTKKESQTTSGSDDSNAVYLLTDENKQISFSFFDTYNYVTVDDSVMTIKNKTESLLNPMIQAKLESGIDAYSAAKSDCQEALLYYNKEELGLSEISVTEPENLLSISINGYSAYGYSRQYSETENGFVSREYCMYVDVGNGQVLYVIVSDLTDPGISVRLTDDSIKEILSHFVIQ